MSTTDPKPGDVTRVLQEVQQGAKSAVDRLLPLIYHEMHQHAEQIFRDERLNHTLQPTALVHDAYLRLIDQKQTSWQDRAHFFAVAATVMRRLLVDHARLRKREKRGGNFQRIDLPGELLGQDREPPQVLAVQAAIELLEQLDPSQARIVELRFFGGMKIEEVAEVVGQSKRTVEREWTMIRAWLRKELNSDEEF